MNTTDTINIIQTLGFPIVMVLLMGWYILKKDKQHIEEMHCLRKALESNTTALTKLETIMNTIIERRQGYNDPRRI